MKKIGRVIACVAVAMIAVASLALPARGSDETRRFLKSMNGMNRVQGTRVPIRDLTSFGWQKVCVVPAYTETKVIEKRLGGRFPVEPDLGWLYRNGAWGITFLRDDGSVIVIEPSASWEWYEPGQNARSEVTCRTSENAVWIVKGVRPDRFGGREQTLVLEWL